jgi:hypothetical protein
MIGKDNDGINRKRPLMARHAKCVFQQVDVFDERTGLPVGKRGGEEERAAG